MSFPAGSLVTVVTNPYFEAEDGTPVSPTNVYLSAGLVTYDANGVRTGPDLGTAMWTYGDSSNMIVQDTSVYADGVFYANLDTTGLPGVWEWRLWGTGQLNAVFVGSFQVTDVYAGWPEPYGYCSPDDVQARINDGSWDSTMPGSFPNPNQVIDYIREASSMIDGALLQNGFYIPLVPRSGFTAIMPQAWLILRTIAAELTAAYVEQARHGSADTQEDSSAKTHLAYAEALLQKIGARQTVLSGPGVGAPALSRNSTISLQPTPLNLYLFGADGAFPPVADKSLGMRFTGSQPTSQGAGVDPYGRVIPDPFTLGMNVT